MQRAQPIFLVLLLLLPLAPWAAAGLPACCLGASCPMAPGKPATAKPHCALGAMGAMGAMGAIGAMGAMGAMSPARCPMPCCGVSAAPPLSPLPALLLALPPAATASGAVLPRRLRRLVLATGPAPALGWRDRVFHPPQA